MPTILIAGSGRGAGKTAVACALITALPEFPWWAIKISPHSHDPGNQQCEETNPQSGKDAGRYLAAGAERAFLISSAIVDPGPAIAAIVKDAESKSFIIESNRPKQDLIPESSFPALSIAVLAGPPSQWKPSLWPRASSLDALILAGTRDARDLPPTFQSKPCFSLPAGQWSTPELIEYVRDRLQPTK